ACAQSNVRGDESNGQISASQTHGAIVHAVALRKKFRLPGEPESDFIQPGLVDWASHNRIEFPAAGECHRFFECSCGGARGFRCRLAGFTIWLAADDDVFSRIGNALRFQSELDNLRPDAGAVAKCDSDARRRARSHARDGNRICSLGTRRITKKMKGKRKRKSLMRQNVLM